MSTPYLLEKIQALTGSDVRATTLSVASMIGRVLSIIWFPIFGRLIDQYSIAAAFIAMSAVFLVVPPVMVRVLRDNEI